MAGNGDSHLAKGSIFKNGRGNLSKRSSKDELSHFTAKKMNSRNRSIMRSGSIRSNKNIASTTEPHDNMRLTRLMKPCKRSGVVSRSSFIDTVDLTKKSISGNNEINYKHNKPPLTHAPPRRRALRFVEDDDDSEDKKIPLHSVTTDIFMRDCSGSFDSERKFHMRPESYRDSPQNASLSNAGIIFIGNVSSRFEERPNNFTGIIETECSASRPCNVKQEVLKSSADLLAGLNSVKQEKCKTHFPNNRAANNGLKSLVDPGNSDSLVCFKALKRQVNGTNLYNAQYGDPCKAFGTARLSGSSSIAEKHKTFLAKSKVIPKSSIPMTNRSTFNIPSECYIEKDVSAGQISDITREVISADSADSKLTDSTVSMRHLIAVAQAKRRQARSHQLLDVIGTPVSSLAPQCILGRNPNLISTMQTFPSGDPFLKDNEFFQASVPSEPPLVSGQFLPVKQREHEDYNHRPSTGNWLRTDSRSVSTEVEVARDAFEGMIKTLSRTRDSIGRATRHAIDCAKYGIANEVVELLICKLEGEPSLSRRIDLFFLVDSITQCSHTQKGISGTSYVPVVQAALPRLLDAAAPTGASAHENRRQCLKVLRLWLERRILPEYFLRHYMDEIEVRNDGMNSRFSLGIPSFAERSMDDPIRKMESLLVDEYGSNTTFLFPGILSAHVLDGDEDFQSSSCNGTADCSPIEAGGISEVLLGFENHPMEAHHHVLEYIENEIEMEDAITISPDERSTLGNYSYSIVPPHQEHYCVVESTCGNQDEILFLPEGSPPLPLDPPPSPPPLPSSPPPPAPPPPPPSSLSLLPPPQSSLTTPPPSPLSFPSEISASISLTQSPLPSSLCRYRCCPSLLQEYYWMANDNQLLQPIGNNSIEYAVTVGVKNEVVMQQSPNFMAPEIINSKQLFQQRGESIQQMRSDSSMQAEFLSNPLLCSQISSHHPIHGKSTFQQHIHQKYNPHTSTFPHGQRNYGSEEQWRSHPSDTNQHNSGAWNIESKTPCSSSSFVQDGYCGLNMERVSSTYMDLHPQHYSIPSPALLPGHSFPSYYL